MTPNRRNQDGEKRYWLCFDCEHLFGESEKAFAERLFHPYLRIQAANTVTPIGFRGSVSPCQDTNAPMSPNINRYLMRAIAMDICRGTRFIFTFAKLGKFVILGIVRDSGMNDLQGTLVHSTQGMIRPRKYHLPRAFLDYLNDKAQTMRGALSSMSDRQHQTVETAFRANVDKFLGSDAFKAMNADVEMFGRDAFDKPRNEEN